MPIRTGAVIALLGLASCGRWGYDELQRHDATPTTSDALDDTVSDGDAGDGGSMDAPFVCPAECNGGCTNGTCYIAGDALTTIVCPPGIPCDISCGGFQSCKADIMCGSASSCVVHCVGDHSCYFGVECGDGPCTLDCIGPSACPAVSHCNTSSLCAITCSGTNSCSFSNHCGAGKCVVDCSGSNACKGSVDCQASCACDVTCAAGAGCPSPPGVVTCPTGCGVANGCDSTVAGCSTCM